MKIITNRIRKFLKNHADKKIEFLMLIVLILLIIWRLNIEIIILVIISFIAFLYGRKSKIIKKEAEETLEKIKNKKLYIILLATITSLMLLWGANIQISIFATIVFALMLINSSSRLIIAAGMVLLGVIPIILVFRQGMFAGILQVSRKEFPVEAIAIYAYYLLLLWVSLQIISYILPFLDKIIKEKIKEISIKPTFNSALSNRIKKRIKKRRIIKHSNIGISKKNIKFLPILYFLILALIILGPILGKGYIFLLDFSLPPEIKFNLSHYISGGEIASGLPLNYLIFLFSKIIAVEILQKILFLLIFTSSGAIFYCVLPKKLGQIPKLIAGTFYMLNPFIYERFISGHIGILLAYALLPVCLFYLIKIFENYKTNNLQVNKNIFWFVFFWTLQILFAVHYLIITAVLLLVFLFINIFFNLKKYKNYLVIFLKITGCFLILNSFWIIPLLVLKFDNLASFDLSHFEVFRSSPDKKYGLIINLMSMYGFWREATAPDEMALTKNFLPLWPIFFSLFLIPMFLGIKQLIKNKKNKLLIILIIVSFIAIFLSIGPTDNIVGSINKWIFLRIPGFRGLREPQKLISLLTLVYSILIAYGLYYLKNIKIKWLYVVIYLIIFVNIFIYNYKMFWGLNGQIKPVPYPISYKQSKEILDQDKSNFQILSLPWQMYMKYSLGGGRTIFDPSRYYFSQDVLATKYMNLKIDNYKASWEEKKILNLLRSTNAQLWQEVLKEMNVKYIFMHKVPLDPNEKFDDWFLEQSDEFEILVEDEYGKLYEVIP